MRHTVLLSLLFIVIIFLSLFFYGNRGNEIIQFGSHHYNTFQFPIVLASEGSLPQKLHFLDMKLKFNHSFDFIELTEQNATVYIPFEIDFWIDRGLIRKYHLTRVSYFGLGGVINLNLSTASFSMEFATKDDPSFENPFPNYSVNDTQYYTKLDTFFRQHGWVPRPHSRLILPDLTLLDPNAWQPIDNNDYYLLRFYGMDGHAGDYYRGFDVGESISLGRIPQNDSARNYYVGYTVVVAIEVNLASQFVKETKTLRPEGYDVPFELQKYVISGWLRFRLLDPLPENIPKRPTNMTEFKNVSQAIATQKHYDNIFSGSTNGNRRDIINNAENRTTSPLYANGTLFLARWWGLLADANGTRFIDYQQLVDWEDFHRYAYLGLGVSWDYSVFIFILAVIGSYMIFRKKQRNKDKHD